MGAGPYRFVRQQAGTRSSLRRSRTTGEVAERQAIIAKASLKRRRGWRFSDRRADVAYRSPAICLETMRQNPKLRLTAPVGGSVWLEMMPDRPDSPLATAGSTGDQPGDRPQGNQRR